MNTEEKTAEKNEYSFRYSYECLPRNKQTEFRNKLKEVLGVTTDKSIWDRISGTIEPRMSESKVIENVFKMYGIEMIWGL